ncbi:MAG TPA: hypothetical protein GX011_03935 [Clostridiales bacterium]|nr:hypothetical protein [Clostridiales bacterium]
MTTTSSDTDAPATKPSGENTTAPAGPDVTTKASEPEKKGGCSSSVAAGLIIPVILMPAIMVRKKKD